MEESKRNVDVRKDQRERTEAPLMASEMKYRRLFETAQDAILILDADSGEIADANPFIQQLLGYSHAEFVGKQLWQLGIFENKEAMQVAFRQLQVEGYLRFEHLPLQSKSGKRIDVEFVSNVYDVTHRRVIQCNIRDVTERIRLEKKTHEQAEALADLHRRKDEFLAMLSHELRNPLAPILNAVVLLRAQQDGSPLQKKACLIIERQVGQLRRLVDELLEISRVITGRIQLRREQVDLSGIVICALETVQPLIDERRHEFTLSLPADPVWLHADAARLEQVVINLLTNAAKYTEEGGRMWLEVCHEGKDAVLRVRDTGVGIAPELLPRVFELFTQADRSLNRAQGGLGIGLALVQRLVELHGGRVEATSVLGEGSQFSVRLPIATACPVQPRLTSETVPPAVRSLRVLVVDDNVDATEMLGMLLELAGHQVRIAHDGRAALDAARDYRPQVLLLDIGLPEMDGYEVARRLRQEPVGGGIVLVAMTGYGRAADHERSREAGFDHHLVKPADFKKVCQILATIPEV